MTTKERWIKAGYEAELYNTVGEEQALAILAATEIPETKPRRASYGRVATDYFREYEGMVKAAKLAKFLVEDYYGKPGVSGSAHGFVLNAATEVSKAKVMRDAYAVQEAMNFLIFQVEAMSPMSKGEREILPQLKRFIRDYDPSLDPMHNPKPEVNDEPDEDTEGTFS